LSSLAGVVGLHEVYLVRASKKQYGVPPHGF
jgi:hypothetical protein